MITTATVLILLVVVLLLVSAWMRISLKEADRRIELNLWMTVHRVALRHGIVIPDGMTLDEAGTYVEQRIDAARKG